MPTKGLPSLRKSPTGIPGLDEITFGGIPLGKATLVCGGAGCGKTIFGMQFLLNGIKEHAEPGVFAAFEEMEEDLVENAASLGFDLKEMERTGKLAIEYIHVEKSQASVTGSFDLEGLFIRLQAACDEVGAKRVVVDTLETLFGGFDDTALLRDEIRRLFRWFKERGLTVVITAERGEGMLTRQGLEEYVSDCVILLDHRIIDQNSTRRMRVVKYRGSQHGTNEYPFLIDGQGISVMPLSSVGSEHKVSDERVATGIDELDAMLEGKGFYRGSTILVSGTAGSGKTSLANCLAQATCRRGERALYLAFEEPSAQIIRNMRSIGLDLRKWVEKGLLNFQTTRPSLYGLEMHLVKILRHVRDFNPSVVIIDPITNLTTLGTTADVHSLLTRLIDYLRSRQITTFFTSLTSGSSPSLEATDVGISSNVDTWLLVRDLESGGERNRGLYVLKSRGMAHSNQIREFLITRDGIRLLKAYEGPEGVLTGSLRKSQEAREKAEALALDEEIRGEELELERRKQATEARIAALNAELKAEEEALRRSILIKKGRQGRLREDRSEMAVRRMADTLAGPALDGKDHGPIR